MPRIKSKASPQKHLPGLGTAAVSHSKETTVQRHSHRGNPFPSLTVATAGETVAQSVAEAAKDSAFAQNPNDLTIGDSLNSDDNEDLDDDEDSESESMTSNSSDDDAEEENSNEDVADPHNYSKLVDSIARYWKMMSQQYLFVLIGLRERVLAEGPSRAGPLNPTQHLCQQMRQNTKTNNLDFKLCPPYSAERKGGRPREEKQIKGVIEIAIDKMEKKKKMAETQKK
jgi:hypothetical protein